jgi:hypothetical protein
MLSMTDVYRTPEVEGELERAERCRQEGNQGRSRVCARLAAGAAVKKFLTEIQYPHIPISSYQTLLTASTLKNLPEEARQSLHLLTLRVNEEHQLPPGVDLIQEAKKLIILLGQLTE